MKYILILFFVIGCESKSQTKFIKITPEKDLMEFMTESGTLMDGKDETEQVYFIPLIKEWETVKMEQGFIVLKLIRHNNYFQNNDPAYKLLDSLNACRKALNMIIDSTSNWSDEEKVYWQSMKDVTQEVKIRFYNHVKIYVEEEALKTGVSDNGYLAYEDTSLYIEPPPDTFLIYEPIVIPSGGGISGRGMGKTVYKLVDTLKDYPITIHGGDSLDTEGWWEGGISIPDSVPIKILDNKVYGKWSRGDSEFISNGQASWNISKQVPWPIAVKDGKEYIATYDSLGNIYFKEKQKNYGF